MARAAHGISGLKEKWASQDPINAVCPTAGPILTPVFVARNCWRKKESVRGCEVFQRKGEGTGMVVSGAVYVRHLNI